MRDTLIVVPVRGERVTEVPYGMGYGGELRAEQQKRAGKMQKSASHPDDSTPGVKPPRKSLPPMSAWNSETLPGYC